MQVIINNLDLISLLLVIAKCNIYAIEWYINSYFQKKKLKGTKLLLILLISLTAIIMLGLMWLILKYNLLTNFCKKLLMTMKNLLSELLQKLYLKKWTVNLKTIYKMDKTQMIKIQKLKIKKKLLVETCKIPMKSILP